MKRFVIVFIIVFFSYFIGDGIYSEINKDKIPGKAKRLECHQNVTVFERSYSTDDLKYAQNLIIQGDDSFTSHIEKAVYSNSVLFNYISLDTTDKIFRKKLKNYIQSNEENKKMYQVSYYIYENDKNDPGKKTKKSKLYAGYVVLEVKNMNNKSIYKVQIDFMDNKDSDIKNCIECAVESLMTFNN